MFDEHFHPMPTVQRRSVIRWILLALHAVPFAVLVFAYPQLLERYPDILGANLARLLISGWGVFLVIHLLLVCLLEFRENVVFARKQRRWLREFREQTAYSRPQSADR